MNGKKMLVVYFSASGVTAGLANTLAKVVNADLYEIKPEQKYTTADLNWKDNHSRSTLEMNDPSSRPTIASKVDNMDQYGIVFVGFPIWWYVAPRIIQTFLESYDFSGKTVIPFATSGSSGMGKTDSILKKSCSSTTNWCTGIKLSGNANETAIKKWIDGLGISK